MVRVAEALSWIVELATRHDLPLQAVGGLAARVYGATRELADLDFYIPMNRFADIEEEVAPNLTRPPAPHCDQHWDLTFAQLDYAGVPIELGDAAGARYYDHRAGLWVPQDIDFSRTQWHTVFGVRIPVMPKTQLITYKRGLDRLVDRQDIVEILRADMVGAHTPDG